MTRTRDYVEQPIPNEVVAIGKDRTKHLRRLMTFQEFPFEWLCWQAYAQGLYDAAETMFNASAQPVTIQLHREDPEHPTE